MTSVTTALVTGVTGQDGGYLTERLLSEGVQVHGLVQDADPGVASFSRAHQDVVLHPGDLTDSDRVSAVVREVAPDEIYNLGGFSSVALSWQQPVLAGAVSGLAVGGVLQAAWELAESTGRPVRVAQASSAEIFGTPPGSPQDEGTPIAPVTPYGAAKAYAHHLVGVYRQRGLHAVSLILYNHESPRRPPTFVTRKITSTVAAIARGEASELVLGNLDARRDWGWAPDYMDAMVRAVRHSRANDYIVATGVAHSVRDFVAAAFDHAGIDDWEHLVRTDPAFLRPAEAVEQVGNPARARDELGWSPTVTFEQLVARMVDADLP